MYIHTVYKCLMLQLYQSIRFASCIVSNLIMFPISYQLIKKLYTLDNTNYSVVSRLWLHGLGFVIM